MRPAVLLVLVCLTDVASAERLGAPRVRLPRAVRAHVVRSVMPGLDPSRQTHQIQNPYTGRVQTLRLTPEEEIVLGEALRPLALQTGGGIHPDLELQRYVHAVGRRLVERNGLHLQTPYPFSFTVVADAGPKVFATPGGRVYVSVGLLRLLQNEAQLATILGHEMGHVVARHGSEKNVQAAVAKGVLQAVQVSLAGRATLLETLAAARDMNRLLLAYRREHEHESDLLGVRFMQGAGYDRAGVLDFVRFLIVMEPRPTGLDDDHPNGISRTTFLAAKLADVPAVRGELGAERYADFVLSRL